MENTGTHERRQSRMAWSTLLLLVILGGSLALNVAQGWKTRAPATARPLGGIMAGSVMPPIPVVDAAGRRTEVRFDGDHPTVLYLLSPQCGWCRRNEENIRALALASSHRYRFIGISTLQTTNVVAYQSEAKLPFPLFTVTSLQEAQAHHLVGTPQTAVILSGGSVAASWGGAYDGDTKRALEEYFHVKLPGLTTPEPTVAGMHQTVLTGGTPKQCLDAAGLSYSKGATIRDATGQITECGATGEWIQTGKR
jgi:hypothetical protein